MATNILWTNIVDPLERLFRTTFAAGLRLYFQDEYETKGSQFVLIRPLSDTETAREGNAATHTYAFELRLYMRQAKQAGDPTGLKMLTGLVEDIKHMIGANRSYSEGGVYRWHEATVTDSSYTPDLSELEAAESGLRVVLMNLTVTCTVAI